MPLKGFCSREGFLHFQPLGNTTQVNMSQNIYVDIQNFEYHRLSFYIQPAVPVATLKLRFVYSVSGLQIIRELCDAWSFQLKTTPPGGDM